MKKAFFRIFLIALLGSSTNSGATGIIERLHANSGENPLRGEGSLNHRVNIKDYGAICDGRSHPLSQRFSTLAAAQAVYPHALALTDEIDGIAIQAFLNAGVKGEAGPGVCLTTHELVWKRGARLEGAGNWSGVSSLYETSGTTVIKYVGESGRNSTVVRMSDAAVGIDPVGSTRDLQNIGLRYVTIDGNSLAEFGLYMVRAWSNNQLDYITITGTLKHAFWAGKCWNGSPTNWMAFKNLGAGITIGDNIFGWDNATVDQSTMTSFFGYYSGFNASTVAQNTFHETANPKKEYGIGVFGGRGIVLINAQAAQNGGAGLYVSPGFKSVRFLGGYAEGNGKSAGSRASWDIWFSGVAGGGSLHTVFDGVYLGLRPSIRITGTEPSRIEAGPKFMNMPFLGTIKADWNNYRIIDSDRSAVFSGVEPTSFRGRAGNALNLDIIGEATFDARSGAISILNKEGIIANITYSAVGTYLITLKENFNSPRYGIIATTGDNRIVAPDVATISVGGFTLMNRANGILSDGNARITVLITGYYH